MASWTAWCSGRKTKTLEASFCNNSWDGFKCHESKISVSRFQVWATPGAPNVQPTNVQQCPQCVTLFWGVEDLNLGCCTLGTPGVLCISAHKMLLLWKKYQKTASWYGIWKTDGNLSASSWTFRYQINPSLYWIRLLIHYSLTDFE